ncbi:hypothetical protein H6F32_06980 [Anabaena sp. FACHB-1237]|uniref:hypothetical protein n=1 Tax=Anabaena sp. FACHB-1237 TaxID=2692769 RepID=UPI0016807EA0|nr:hypothetical protein [Anabaena sp. FACHB-1237]MBD2137333.1 hypothetical protein [Anabaena sp. FACHB-1237]
MIRDHKLISSLDFRKHHDSPFLWIFVTITSLSLHLLVFWLIQSYTIFSSSLSGSKKNIISVDFIDISNSPISQKYGNLSIANDKNSGKSPNYTEKLAKKPSSSAKIISDQDLQNLENNDSSITSSSPIPSSQKNQTTNSQLDKNQLSKSPTTKSENNQSRNSQSLVHQNPNPQTTTKPENKQHQNSQSPVHQNPNFPPDKTTKSENNQSQNNLPVKQQPYPAFTNTPQPKITIPPQEKPWERRQDVKLGEEKPLPQDIKPEPSKTDQREDRGGAIATITPLIKDEVNELIRQRKLLVDALPDIFPEYKGSETQDIDISLLANDVILQPASIFASLIIDKDGKFRQSVIVSIEPDTLYTDKKIYENALNQIFQQSSFTSAVNKDGSKPELSNLYVRLKIDLTN